MSASRRHPPAAAAANGSAGSLLYLTEEQVERHAPPPARLADALEEAFRLRHAGRVAMPPKAGLTLENSDAFFHAMPAAVPSIGAGVKWVGGAPGNTRRGLPHIGGLMVLSDAGTGHPTAVLEAAHLTGIRTAAISLVAARYLARPDARTLALIGCGFQARTHLEALASAFPLSTVLLVSRSRPSVRRLAEIVAAAGLRPEETDRPDDAVARADIIVSTVPAEPGLAPFLDAGLLREGAMASMVDLGRSWKPEGLGHFAGIFTDDLEQSRALAGSNATFAAARFDGDLGALAAAASEGRSTESDRLGFLFPGVAFADVVAAELIVRRAREEIDA